MIFLWAIFAFIIGSFIEWFAHRYILHNFKYPIFSKYHFGRHHRRARQNRHIDSDYQNFPPKSWSSGFHEIAGICTILIVVLPTVFISPWLWYFLCVHGFCYYYLHRKSHLNSEWAKKWLPWHWRHHMGKDQNANWGVTTPLFDYVFGTVSK